MQPILLVIFLIGLITPLEVWGKEQIQIVSDEPGIIGSNITFTVTLLYPEQSSYDIAWQEVIWPLERNFRDVLNKGNNYSSNWTQIYWVDTFQPGTYSVIATVSYQYFFYYRTVGTVVTYFSLMNNFTGSLNVSQPSVKRKDPTFVSTMNETELIVDVHDSYNFLSKADNVTWSWYNQTGFMENTTTPSIRVNFTKEGDYTVNVTLTALYNTTTPNTTVGKRGGVFRTNVTAKIPIVNFTVSGETWFPQGRLLNLKFNCQGSKPFTYCFQMLQGPYNLTGNETCETFHETSTYTNDCEIPFVRYFDEPGLRSLIIIMENDVSSILNKTLINAYKVNKKQPLSIIIVPITCTLLALVIIIFGIAYFCENRARFTVEVADFDFGQNDELPYMTFMERLKDAITSTGATRQRMYHPPDDEPILSSRRASQFS